MAVGVGVAVGIGVAVGVGVEVSGDTLNVSGAGVEDGEIGEVSTVRVAQEVLYYKP